MGFVESLAACAGCLPVVRRDRLVLVVAPDLPWSPAAGGLSAGRARRHPVAESRARYPGDGRPGYRRRRIPLRAPAARARIGGRAALNLYSRAANTFDESARTTAGLFGLQAALLLYGVNHARQLGQALASRDLIGQAKGILMERFRVDSERAFRMLVSSSQQTNIKLVEVARWLTETGSSSPDDMTGRRPHA